MHLRLPLHLVEVQVAKSEDRPLEVREGAQRVALASLARLALHQRLGAMRQVEARSESQQGVRLALRHPVHSGEPGVRSVLKVLDRRLEELRRVDRRSAEECLPLERQQRQAHLVRARHRVLRSEV